MKVDRSSGGQDALDAKLVAVVDADQIRAENKPLDDRLAPLDDVALAAFLEFAWDAPGDWHRLPESSFALRSIPTVVRPAPPTTSFEIRSDTPPGTLYRYEYDSRSNVLRYWRDKQVEHSEINPKHGLSNDPLEFALTVVAFIRAASDFHTPDDFPGTAVHLAKGMYPDSPAHGPLQGAFASIVTRMVNQWFGPKAFGWNGMQRLGVALAGSGLFVVVWLAFVLLDPGSKYEYFRKYSAGEDLIPVIPYSVLAIVAFFFAWLVSWKNQGHGPIRLFFYGFLLPYLVWMLISSMPGIESSTEKRKSDSVTSEQSKGGDA